MFTDTHCHLDDFEDVDGLLAAAASAGVSRLVAVGQDAATMQKVLDCAARHPHVIIPALGIHPVNVTRRPREQIDADLDFLSGHLDSAVEIGEAGLDYKWAASDEQKSLQRVILEEQLELAARARLPVNLHSRRCLRQVMERAIAFHRDTGLNAQLHWFTQSEKLIRICNDEEIFISVGPSVIDQERCQTVARQVADELLLLETDAPVPIGGHPGHPRRIREVAEKLAELRGVSLHRIAELTEANFSRFLQPGNSLRSLSGYSL